ncbi:amino acid permease, partial [Enterococcus faecalis]
LPKGTASPLGMLAYNISGLIVFMGFAWICWKRYETKEKNEVGKGEMDYEVLGKL